MEIGERIKHFRNQQNLSMNQLAKKSKADQSALSEIEAGKRQPTFKVLEKIVAGLGVTLSEFFSEDQIKKETLLSVPEKLLLNNFKKLDDADKRTIISLAERLVSNKNIQSKVQ